MRPSDSKAEVVACVCHLSSLLRSWNSVFRIKTRYLTAFVTVFRLVGSDRGTRTAYPFTVDFGGFGGLNRVLQLEVCCASTL